MTPNCYEKIDTIKILWTILKYGVKDRDQVHSLPKNLYV